MSLSEVLKNYEGLKRQREKNTLLARHAIEHRIE